MSSSEGRKERRTRRRHERARSSAAKTRSRRLQQYFGGAKALPVCWCMIGGYYTMGWCLIRSQENNGRHTTMNSINQQGTLAGLSGSLTF